MALTSPGAPKSVVCFTNQSADETLGQWIDVRGYANVSFYLTGSGTILSGVVTLEEAAPVAGGGAPVVGLSTGGYSVITTINASLVSGGAQLAYHCPPDVAYAFVRPRISTVLAGTNPLLTVTLEAS
jgi:hypothetical protein